MEESTINILDDVMVATAIDDSGISVFYVPEQVYHTDGTVSAQVVDEQFCASELSKCSDIVKEPCTIVKLSNLNSDILQYPNAYMVDAENGGIVEKEDGALEQAKAAAEAINS